MRPRALRTSMPARSNTSSPDRPVSAGQTTRRARRRRHIGVGDVARPCAAMRKSPCFGSMKGMSCRSPRTLKSTAAGAALGDRIAHVVARGLRDVQRQVAPDTRVPSARVSLPCRSSTPGIARGAARDGRVAGAPAGLGLALGIDVGEAQVRQLQLHRVAVELPLQLGRQPVDRHHRLLEHARQVERAAGDRQRGAAAGLAGVEVDRGAAHAGRADRHVRRRGGGAVAAAGAAGCGGRHAGLRRHAEAAHAALQLVGGRARRAGPCQLASMRSTSAARLRTPRAACASPRPAAAGRRSAPAPRGRAGPPAARRARACAPWPACAGTTGCRRASACRPRCRTAAGGLELQRAVAALAGQAARDVAQHQRLERLAERDVDAVSTRSATPPTTWPSLTSAQSAQAAAAFADSTRRGRRSAELRHIDVAASRHTAGRPSAASCRCAPTAAAGETGRAA